MTRVAAKHYAEARGLIRPGDLLLFRRLPGDWRPSNLYIARVGRTEFIHAATVAEEAGELRLLEVVQFRGGRDVSLLSEVKRYPGRYVVFRPNPGERFPEYDPTKTVAEMRSFVGRPYGWFSILRAGLFRLPGIRLCLSPATDDEAASKHFPFCSQARAIADRRAGVDPVLNLADRATEPGDFARSPFYRALFALIP